MLCLWILVVKTAGQLTDCRGPIANSYSNTVSKNQPLYAVLHSHNHFPLLFPYNCQFLITVSSFLL